jgi:hypothetical protein
MVVGQHRRPAPALPGGGLAMKKNEPRRKMNHKVAEVEKEEKGEEVSVLPYSTYSTSRLKFFKADAHGIEELL